MPQLNELRFGAYTQAVARFRWSLITILLLSALMMMNSLLSTFSHRKEVLRRIYAVNVERAGGQILSTLEVALASGASRDSILVRLNRVIDKANEWIVPELGADRALPGFHGQTLEEKRRDFEKISEMFVTLKRTKNTLENSLRHDDMTLPLIGTQIPADDYLPMLAAITAVFYVLAALSLHVVRRALAELVTDIDDYGRAAPHHFIFFETTKLMAWLAVFVPLVPVVVVAASAALDFRPLYLTRPQLAYYGPLSVLNVRLGIYGLCVLMMAVIYVLMEKALFACLVDLKVLADAPPDAPPPSGGGGGAEPPPGGAPRRGQSRPPRGQGHRPEASDYDR
jgi:hypothetical protein